MATPVSTLSLAVSMYDNKGAYALLLGSGLSSAAGIFTGWQIGQDMIRKARAIDRDDDSALTSEQWFESRYGVRATYSNILEALDPAPGDRAGALRTYIEPTTEDRETDAKVPTEAHHAIAAIVGRGYIRVILTTNVDPLLEQALDSASVPYQLVASPDDVEGMRPLMLSTCTIVKVNGDYRDSRIKNTGDELAEYDPRMAELVRRVLDELGLIVCGWSADSDVALAELVRGHRSRLYGTYWTHRRALPEFAASVADARGAHLVKIEDANGFFRELDESATSLEHRLGGLPVDVSMVFDAVRRYVTDDRHRARLDDLVRRLTIECISAFPEHDRRPDYVPWGKDQLRERLAEYETVSAPLVAALVAGCYWGGPSHARIWSEVITHVARLPGNERGPHWVIDLRLYPALLLMHAGGIAAVARRRYENLAAVLLRAQTWNSALTNNIVTGPALLGLRQGDVLSDEAQSSLSDPRTLWAFSDHLQKVLQPAFAPIYLHERDFERWFDTFEYLMMLVHARQYYELAQNFFAPRSRLMQRGPRGKFQLDQIIKEFNDEAVFENDDWGANRFKLFSGTTQFQELVRETNKWRIP
jgi:hypothetical protein